MGNKAEGIKWRPDCGYLECPAKECGFHYKAGGKVFEQVVGERGGATEYGD